MLEKNKSLPKVATIEFNWERVKKKAASKREELINNTPKIIKRPITPIPDMNSSAINQSEPSHISSSPVQISGQTTNTTDTLYDPYDKMKSVHDIQDNKANQVGDGTDTPRLLNKGTEIPKLLPAAPAQGSHSHSSDSRVVVCGDESLGPDKNAVELLRALKQEEITGKELTLDERRLVVDSMRGLGQTQDAIAELLQVSRRTVVADYKVIRQEQALTIAKTDTEEIAGEVYATAKTCIRRALQAGSFKTVSVIMRDMVEVLQSLGVVYRAPKTSMQAMMHGSIPGSNKGYQKYMDGIGDDKNKVVEVLDCMFNAIDTDNLTGP